MAGSNVYYSTRVIPLCNTYVDFVIIENTRYQHMNKRTVK